jgi:hypothetical protein
MKICFIVSVIVIIMLTVLMGGCMDVLTKQKVGGFGDAQSSNSSSQQRSITPAGTGTSASDFRQGSIYAMCYPACTKAQKKSVDDCDKACCLAQCQPRTPDDTKRCASICGVNLEKTTNI